MANDRNDHGHFPKKYTREETAEILGMSVATLDREPCDGRIPDDGKRRVILQIVPDERYPHMWRIKLPGGGLSEMPSRPRVRDAAMSHALMLLNSQNNRRETGSEAPPVRSNHSTARLGRWAA